MPSEALRIELGGTGSTVSTKDDRLSTTVEVMHVVVVCNQETGKLCWGPAGQKCRKPWSDPEISSERSMESCCHFPLNSLEPRRP